MALVPAAASRHPHLADPRRPGHVRVDLHSHTMWSGDSTTTPEELEQAVAESGLDVLCITDHNAIRGAQELAGRLPCRVIVGEELRTHAGEIIGLFLTERVPFGVSPGGGGAAHPRPGRPRLRPPSRSTRCGATWPRPALVDLVDAGLVDAIEVFNAKTSLGHLNEQAAAFAAEPRSCRRRRQRRPRARRARRRLRRDARLRRTGGLPRRLREGVVVGHHFDAPRPWRARIVPTTTAG